MPVGCPCLAFTSPFKRKKDEHSKQYPKFDPAAKSPNSGGTRKGATQLPFPSTWFKFGGQVGLRLKKTQKTTIPFVSKKISPSSHNRSTIPPTIKQQGAPLAHSPALPPPLPAILPSSFLRNTLPPTTRLVTLVCYDISVFRFI